MPLNSNSRRFASICARTGSQISLLILEVESLCRCVYIAERRPEGRLRESRFSAPVKLSCRSRLADIFQKSPLVRTRRIGRRLSHAGREDRRKTTIFRRLARFAYNAAMTFMRSRLIRLCSLCILCSWTAVAAQEHEHAAPPNEKLGTVTFATSCSPLRVRIGR
jgi:hypothetical protein